MVEEASPAVMGEARKRDFWKVAIFVRVCGTQTRHPSSSRSNYKLAL